MLKKYNKDKCWFQKVAQKKIQKSEWQKKLFRLSKEQVLKNQNATKLQQQKNHTVV